MQPLDFSKIVWEWSIRFTRNCRAPSGFRAKFQTTEQLVTCGTAMTPPEPRNGWSRIFLATSGSCFSAARRRLMAWVVAEVLRASIARGPPGELLRSARIPVQVLDVLQGHDGAGVIDDDVPARVPNHAVEPMQQAMQSDVALQTGREGQSAG